MPSRDCNGLKLLWFLLDTKIKGTMTRPDVQIRTIIITDVYGRGAAEEFPWDSSTHKGGTQSPPLFHTAMHCTGIYVCILGQPSRWNFLRFTLYTVHCRTSFCWELNVYSQIESIITFIYLGSVCSMDFSFEKVLFRSLSEVLGDQIVNFSGHSEQEYLLWYWL